MTEEQSLTVGQYLRQEREQKNLTLEKACQVTRITKESLTALEKDDFQSISSPVFVRGFLRSYATFLGLDPHQVISRYDSQVDLLKTSPKTKEPTLEVAKEGNPLLKYLTLLSIIIIGVAIAFYYFQKSSIPPSPPAPSVALAPSSKPEAPSPPAVAAPPAEKVTPPTPQPVKEPAKVSALKPAVSGDPKKDEEKNVLKAVATAKTWMRVRREDYPLNDVMLEPGESATWTSRGKFTVTVGNAGGIEIFFGGVSQGRPGKSGDVVFLTFPKGTTPPKQVIPKPEPEKKTQ